MARLIAQVQVNVTAVVAFEELANWEGQGTWIPATTVRVVAGVGTNADDAIEARSAIGPVGFTDKMRVVRFRRPELIDVVHEGWLIKGLGRMRVIPVDSDNCRVVVVELIRMPLGLVGEVAWLLIKPFARTGLSRSLRRFKTIVEAR